MLSPIANTESLASVAHKISAVFALVQKSTVSNTNCADQAGIINEQQRFEIWATNLGLYHGGHSSLDYRFRDASVIFDYTKGLLRELESVLTRLLGTLSDDSEQSLVNNVDNNGDEALISEDEFSSDEDSSYGDLPLTTILLENAQQTIDRLYRLAFKIRNPAMRLGLSKASRHRELDPETGVDLVDQYVNIDQRHLLEILASYQGKPVDKLQNHYLVHRLAKANTRRRQQYLYWRRRDSKLEKYSRPEIEGKHTEIANEATPLVMEGVERMQLNVSQPATSRPSTATLLEESKVKLDDDVSMISSSTVFTEGQEENSDQVCIPKPPEKYWDQKEFKCPYCYTLCPRKLLAKKAWETHVIRDLRPYICTYADCNMADQLYDSLTDWMSHEATKHGAAAELSDGKANTSLQVGSRDCPLCRAENASPFHIASHLRRIACFTLPRSIGHDTESELEGNASYSAQVVSHDSRFDSSEFGSGSSNENASWGEGEAESFSPGTVGTGSSLTAETLNQQMGVLNVDKSPQIQRFLQQLDEKSVYSRRTLSGDVYDDGESKEKGRCPFPDCGRFFIDLKAHMLTHQVERPEKCPIKWCEYHEKGFARKYDRNRHTLTHYKGTMICGFCPGSGTPAEKAFNRADVFKRHLTSVHGVEQVPPNQSSRKPDTINKNASTTADTDGATGMCSICDETFSNAQEFYEHLDDCVLRMLIRQAASEENMEDELDAKFRQALPATEENLRPEHPDILNRAIASDSISNLGDTYYKKRQYESAASMYRQVLEFKEKDLGVEDPETLSYVRRLGDALYNQRKYGDAEKMYRRVLDFKQKELGVEHPDTLSYVRRLGDALYNQRKYEDAEKMYRRVLVFQEKYLGAEHPDTLKYVSNLSHTLYKQGKYREAEGMYRRVLEFKEKELGIEHPDTVSYVGNLGHALAKQGNYEEAEEMYRRVLEVRDKNLGAEHPDTLAIANNLSDVLARQGKHAHASWFIVR